MQKIGNDELSVIAFALRYAVTRHTYAPSLVCAYIEKRIPDMTAEQRGRILCELDDFENAMSPFSYADRIAWETGRRLKIALEVAGNESKRKGDEKPD